MLCEKPLANTVAEAADMADAARLAEARGVRSMVGFTYRRVPALALAKQLVDEGRLGTIRHVRAQYLQDWIVDPTFPLVWRLQKDKAGSGALGDIGAHVIDLAQHLTGSAITGVSGLTETFIRERPLPAPAGGPSASGGPVTRPVPVALFSARFASGAIGAFEATRFASGRKNSIRIELNGSRGSLAFDFESMNELHVHDHTEPAATAGFRRILVTEPTHPYAGRWWPPGHGLGYEHAFAHEIADLVQDIAAGRSPSPTFDDGLQVQRVLEAVEQSAAKDSLWTPVSTST